MSEQYNSKIKEVYAWFGRRWLPNANYRNWFMRYANKKLRAKYRKMIKKDKEIDIIQYGAGWLD